MEKKTLASLFTERLYQIPDYQRGYAWEKLQWDHFIQDVDALIEDDNKIKSHYTGTVVVYQDRSKPVKDYGTDKHELVDVVDGQQRLTTCCLYLSIILRALKEKGISDYDTKIPQFLYSGNESKLTLNNESKDIFHDLLSKGTANLEARTVHQKRLRDANLHFKKHIDEQVEKRDGNSVAYLKGLVDAIIRKLNFTFYTIEEECEIGMTFELMNSRGKGLSILELLKNYLMYWISRNEPKTTRKDLTDTINKSWKEVYDNIGQCGGNEDQALRTAWTIFCTYTPKNWQGYEGFKGKDYIPIRDFSRKSITKTKEFILKFSDGLAGLSKHYAVVTSPDATNTQTPEEFRWLSKIHNTGNIANFLPLIIATRSQCLEGSITSDEYCEVLKAIECYAFRVFLSEGRRSNAGISNLYQWGNEVHNKRLPIQEVPGKIYGLINHYSDEKTFIERIDKIGNWYSHRRVLRYTLFEYELHLLAKKGKGLKPKLAWGDLSDSTLEHILPQNPDEQAQWKIDWSEEDIEKYLHDIGNLVLTVNNSNYRNFDFDRKKGEAGKGFCYANSDIRQERELAGFDEWKATSVVKRRVGIAAWIKDRWGVASSHLGVPEEINEDEDHDE